MKQYNQAFRLFWTAEQQHQGLLLRDFLQQNGISKRALTAIKFEGGRIQVNGEEQTVRRMLHPGDLVEVFYPPEQISSSVMPEDLPLGIVYEDEYLLVTEKPAGQSTIPSREHPSGSLANALTGYYRAIGLQSAVHVVTRLDRDTSGLVLIAKHSHVHHLFSQQQKSRSIQRMYTALAEGTGLPDTGVIELPIGRKPDSIIEREVREDGQYACTRFKVTGRSSLCTLVELRLLTGRTHQIRVHLSAAGHPLAGDDLYGGSRNLIGRQALHCGSLSFVHPFTGNELAFSSRLPDDIRRAAASCGIIGHAPALHGKEPE